MKKTIEVGKRYTIRNSFYATAIYFTKVEGRPLTLDYYVDGLVWDNWMRFQGVYRNWKLLFAPNIAGKAMDRSLWISSIIIKCSAKWDDESIIKFRQDICTFYDRDYPCQFTRDEATKVSTYLYNSCFVKEALNPIKELENLK